MKNALKKVDYVLLSLALNLKTWVVLLLVGAIIIWFVKSNAILLMLLGLVSFMSGKVFQRKPTKLSYLFNFLSFYCIVMGIILFILNIPVGFTFICPGIIGFCIPDNTTFEEAKRDLDSLRVK